MSTLRETLEAAKVKLGLYRAVHSGIYVGGVEYMALIKMIDAALAAEQPQLGWKLVPIEPTPEMLFAGHMKIDFDRSEQNTYEMSHESQRGPEGVGTTIEQDMRDCWSAMIAAAPNPNHCLNCGKPLGSVGDIHTCSPQEAK